MRLLAISAGRVDAVAARHLDVHDHQVGLEGIGQLDRLLAVARLADDLISLFFQHLGQVEPNECLIFGDEDAARLRRLRR